MPAYAQKRVAISLTLDTLSELCLILRSACQFYPCSEYLSTIPQSLARRALLVPEASRIPDSGGKWMVTGGTEPRIIPSLNHQTTSFNILFAGHCLFTYPSFLWIFSQDLMEEIKKTRVSHTKFLLIMTGDGERLFRWCFSPRSAWRSSTVTSGTFFSGCG